MFLSWEKVVLHNIYVTGEDLVNVCVLWRLLIEQRHFAYKKLGYHLGSFWLWLKLMVTEIITIGQYTLTVQVIVHVACLLMLLVLNFEPS